MSDFIPPFPPRLPKPPTPWERVRLGRHNLLAAFEEQAFSFEFVSMRLLAREVFLCNTPESVQFAFSTHHDSFERKSPSHRRSLEPLLGEDGVAWRRRRHTVAPIIHVSRLPEFAPVMAETAHATCRRWAELGPFAEIDALAEMAQLTAEILCRTVFGRQLGRDRALLLVEGFADYQRRVGQIDFFWLLGLPNWVPRPHPPGIYRSARRVHKVLDELIAENRTHHTRDDPSIVNRLLDARDEETGAPLDARALRNEAGGLLWAGHETTASTLAWTWYILSQVPEVEATVHEEVDRVLGGRLPTLADVPKLVYTRAVFEEVLRLYPPAPVLTREAVRDEQFYGCRIPKGSLVMVCPWLLHRHRLIWHKPDHFVPERFLPGGFRPTSKFAYIPFSVGPRVCTGLAFGLTEAILSIAIIAQNFMLRLIPGHRVELSCRLTLRPGETLPMQLVPRRSVESAVADPDAVHAIPVPVAAAGAWDGQAGCPYHGRSEAARP